MTREKQLSVLVLFRTAGLSVHDTKQTRLLLSMVEDLASAKRLNSGTMTRDCGDNARPGLHSHSSLRL